MPTTGSLGDANCNVEAVEFANSAQLSSILTQLLNSTYFRLFKVRRRAPAGVSNLPVPKTLTGSVS